MSRLLIVYHSKNGSTARLAEAALAGASHPDVETSVRIRTARAAVADDLLWCDAVLLGTPENFGYMSGAMKDFLDRVYYTLEGRIEGLPYAVFVSAGNDGTGAVRAIERIVKGFPFRQVRDPLIVTGHPTEESLEACKELGMYMAAGVDAGIF